MKKITILLLLTFALTQSLSAQNYNKDYKRVWLDFQVAQHIGLNKWSNVDYVNDGLPSTSVTEFRGTFNCLLGSPHFGVFTDMAIGIMPAPKMSSFSIENMPMPHNGTQYHLRDIISESGSGSASAHFKMTFGLFGNLKANENLTIMPYLGVGFMTMSERKYDVLLKEEGSNMQYYARYAWNSVDGKEYGNPATLGYMNGRLNFKYRLSPKSNLMFGLEYSWFFNSLDFYGKYTNTFNANIQKDFSVKGNKVNMLGISLGISFM